MQEWINKEKWSEVAHEASAHVQMEVLQKLLVKKYHEYFPEKTRTIYSDDQPYFTGKLQTLKRKKSREFHKHRKSIKWKIMNIEYESELSKARKVFYNKKIKNLKKVKSKNWFRELKKF